MRTILIALILTPLVSCTDNNVSIVTSQYYLRNDFDSSVELVLYEDSGFLDELHRIEIQPGDSSLIYECVDATSEGICTPFDGDNRNEVMSDFGAILFEDMKAVRFERFVDIDQNLFLLHNYHSINISNQLFIHSYSIDEEDYSKAE